MNKMKLRMLKIEPWTTAPDRYYRESEFVDESTGVVIKIPLSEDDVAIIEEAMKAVVSRVLEVMKNG